MVVDEQRSSATAPAWAAAWRARYAAVAALVYPPGCALCRGAVERGEGTCSAHALRLGFDEARCGRCLAALGEGLADGDRCARCRRASPRFARLFALGPYVPGDGLATWVLALKYGGRPDLAEPLGAALAATLPPDLDGGPRGLLVLPVPLHPLRRLERGYDQAELLARRLADAAGLPWRRGLRRARRTPPQGSAAAPARGANVARAFAARRGGEALRGRVVLLVDDVATSGATLSACADVARRAGAVRVHAAVLARAGDRERAEARVVS